MPPLITLLTHQLLQASEMTHCAVLAVKLLFNMVTIHTCCHMLRQLLQSTSCSVTLLCLETS